MKVVIWILACVVLVGCESLPLDTQTSKSSGNGVSRELATAVRRALDAKRVEETRLVEYTVEKQRLVSRLLPIDVDVDWTDLHALAVEDFVTKRDAGAAKNLSVLLELERRAFDRKRHLEDAIAAAKHWLEAGRLYRISGVEATHHEEQGVELFVVIERLKDLVTAPPLEPPLLEIDGRSLKRELARVAVQERQREEAESRAKAERNQRLEASVVTLRNRLSQERDRNEKLRDQLARVQEQHQHLQDEHRRSQLAAHESQQQIAALETELVQQREARTRDSQTLPVTASKAHVDQTPRPMAPYGYWASPSGYRYGGRW